MPVFVEGLGISASCPSDVAVESNTTFGGSITYTLVNTGTSEAFVDILAEMVDTAGHRTTDLRNSVRVGAGETSRVDHDLQLAASYDQVGIVTVTVRLSVTGEVTFSDSTFCTFVVS